MTGATKVIGYTRVSTQMQVEDGYSLGNQEAVIKERCNYEKWELVNIFSDEGKSGATMENRSGLKSLLDFVEEHKIERVLIYKVSRLSRKISEAIIIVEELERKGCSVIAVKDNVDTSTPIGKYFLVFGAIFAEMERDNLITQIRDGMRQKALDGEWSGGTPPLGYDLVKVESKEKSKKKLVVNEEEAKTVLMIFGQYLNGKGYKAIAEALNNKGRKTKAGKAFSGNSVKDILKNPIYMGMIRWGYSQKVKGSDKRTSNNSEGLLTKGKHEAIITQEIYEKVQHKIKTNPRHSMSRFNGNHMLSGLLRCPHCGEYGMSIQQVKDKKRNKMYEYYICNQYQSTKKCSAKGIRKKTIETEFLNLFEERMGNLDNLTEILAEMNTVEQQVADLEKTCKQKLKQIDELNKKTEKLVDTLSEPDTEDLIKDTIKKKISNNVKEIEELQKEIIELQGKKKEVAASKLDSTDIKTVLKQVGKVIPHLDKPKQQALVRMVVKKITIKDGRIEKIHFHFEKDLTVGGEEGDSDESPSSESSFEFIRGTVNRTINKNPL